MAETPDPEQLLAMITAVLRDPSRDPVTGDSPRQRINRAVKALKFVPLDRWEPVIELALDLAGATAIDGPGDVILEASRHCPHLLTPHLRRIWDLKLNAGREHEMAPWRGADEAELRRLAAVVDLGDDPHDVRRAYAGLLESRSTLGLQLALDRMESADVQPADAPWAGRFDEVLSAWDTPGRDAFQSVGYDLENGTLRPLCTDHSFHLRFDSDYVQTWRSHPTWFDIGEPAVAATFGGSRSSTCLLCHEPLCGLLTLDPVPPSLGVTGRQRLDLVTCLTCVGWCEPVLFFHHDQSGEASMVEHLSEQRMELPDGLVPGKPFPVTQVGLVPTPDRWRFQRWEGNLHRLGGEPTWLQRAEYPTCPQCERTMPLLMQVGGGLPSGEYGPWLWGSGGLAYICWCDTCSMSATFWQCT